MLVCLPSSPYVSNPLWLTGLKAPTNKLTNYLPSVKFVIGLVPEEDLIECADLVEVREKHFREEIFVFTVPKCESREKE